MRVWGRRGQVAENKILYALCVCVELLFISTSTAGSWVGRACDCVVTGVGDWRDRAEDDCGVCSALEEGAGCCSDGCCSEGIIYLYPIVGLTTYVVVTTSALNRFTQCINQAHLVLGAFVYFLQSSGPNSASPWLLPSLEDKFPFGITTKTISPFGWSGASFRHSKKNSQIFISQV